MTKDETFRMRLTPADLQVLQAAAVYSRRSVSEFVRHAALVRAQEVLAGRVEGVLITNPELVDTSPASEDPLPAPRKVGTTRHEDETFDVFKDVVDGREFFIGRYGKKIFPDKPEQEVEGKLP